jgi:hypothetical protein
MDNSVGDYGKKDNRWYYYSVEYDTVIFELLFEN